MSQSPYELVTTPDGVVARISARGSAVLGIPSINQGTAFTQADRRALGLTGLLPRELDDLVQRVHAAMWRPEYPAVEAVISRPVTADHDG